METIIENTLPSADEGQMFAIMNENGEIFATMSSDELRKKDKKITSPGKRKGYLLYLFCYLWNFSHKVIDDFDFLIFLLALFSDFAYQNTVNKAVQYGFV